VLNEALCLEDVLGSGGVAPHILHPGTRWRWVVSFTLREGASGTHWMAGWVPELFWTWWWRENSQPLLGIEPQNPDRPAQSL